MKRITKMAKDLLFGADAKQKMVAGITKVCDAVASTLGPKGNNVAIERNWGAPSVIHDGVSVAKEIDLEDKFENMGAQLIKEAAQKTNDSAGDGTTTATILTKAIIVEAMKNIAAGANARMLRKGIDLAVESIDKNLVKLAKEVKTDEEIRQIANISAQDEEIGNLISGAIKKLGRDCVIAVEEHSGTGIKIEYKEGMELSKGYASPYLVTNQETGEAVVDEPHVLVTDERIENPGDFQQFLDKYSKFASAQGHAKLYILCESISGLPLTTLVVNVQQGNLKLVVSTIPGYGDNKKDVLEDIAILTGGVPVTKERGGIKNVTDVDFGKANKIIATKDNTVIIGGAGAEQNIKDRIDLIKSQIEKSESEFEREKLQERLAKLDSGIAVIKVGANSEMEMREKKECCIDAISATRAAIDEGIVPGGGIPLIAASAMASIDVKLLEAQGDVKTGINIILEAVRKPFEILMLNSGFNPGEMLYRVMAKPMGHSVDVMTGKISDMVKAGIVDPVKVTRMALINAASTATMVMTTDTLIAEIKEKQNDTQG